MRTNIFPKSKTNTSLVLLIVVGCFTYNHAQDNTEGIVDTLSNAMGESFTVMDVDAMLTYRAERQAELEESLELSSLSVAHQEIIANAMAKLFVGIPLSSYTENSRDEQLQEETSEDADNWTIKADGHLHYEALQFFPRRLTTGTPFVFFHPVPFRPETGVLADSTDTDVIFEFDADPSKIDATIGDGVLANFPMRSRLIVELIADKNNQTPKRITIKLPKPIRIPLILAIKKVSLQYDFSFIESCRCFAINRMKTQLDASLIFRGRELESNESTYTNFVCDQPLQFLLPQVY